MCGNILIMNFSSPNIVLAGHVCIDRNKIDGVPVTKWGSSVMYMARLLSTKYDVEALAIAPYGEDFVYKDEVSLLNAAQTWPTMIYENILNNGHRVQYCHNYQHSALPQLENNITEALQAASIFVLAPLAPTINVDQVTQYVKQLPSDCLKVLLPQGYMRNFDSSDLVSKRQFIEAAQLLPLFDVVVASDEDCDNALDQAKEWSIFNSQAKIVITQAGNGATFFAGQQSQQVPTVEILPKDIINPVGCGDMFSAQLMLSLSQGLDISSAVSVANTKTAEALKSKPLV